MGYKQTLLSWAQMPWGCCTFMGLVSLLNQEDFKPWWLSMEYSSFALVVQTGYVLHFPYMKKKCFSCKLRFSTKENTLGVPFEGWKICAMNQGSEHKRQPIGLFPEMLGMSILEIGKWCFPEPRCFQAAVHSLSWISSVTMRIPNFCLWSLRNVHFDLVLWTSYLLIFPDIEKKDFSCLVRHLV